MLSYLLMVCYIISCLVLILFVLLQPGKSDASGMFGGGGVNSTAFGPRGTQTVLAKITIGAAVAFFLIAFLFSIPGLFDKRSLGEGVGPAEPAPITTPAPTDQPTPPTSSAAPPPGDTAPAAAKPAEQGNARGAAAQPKKGDAAKKKP